MQPGWISPNGWRCGALCQPEFSSTLVANTAPVAYGALGAYPQYLVMLVLWEQARAEAGPHTVKTLGERLHLDSGTLTPMLKRMEQAGLVARSRAADDERQVTISLTAKGRALEAAVAAMQRDMACLLPLGLQDLARLRTELRGLAAGLQASAGK